VGVTILPRFPMDRWPLMQAFLARRYRPDLALCNREMFVWFFRASTGSAEIVSAWDGDRLIGTMGYIAGPVFWGRFDEPQDGAWLVNWVVDPDYRHGVGIALMREVQARFPVLLGIGAGAENERIVARLRWAIFPNIPRYVAVLGREQSEALAFPGAASDVPSAVAVRDGAERALRSWRPDDPAPAWERYAPLIYGTVRSSAYLRWRYLEHPVFRFEIVATGSPAAPAIAVYRVERAQGTGIPVGRVMEFFHPGDPGGSAAGVDLARALLARFRDAGCAFADFVCSSTAYGATLAEAGWTFEDPQRAALPVRLQPVERATFRYNLEYGAASGLARPELGVAYVTRGDGDADRPARSEDEVRVSNA
jgi:hypothetical protein